MAKGRRNILAYTLCMFALLSTLVFGDATITNFKMQGFSFTTIFYLFFI